MKNFLLKYYPFMGLGVVVFIYILFFINVFTWESYMYSVSNEGIYDIRHKFATVNSEIKAYPDFNIYHPNHPLLHVITHGIFKAAGSLGFYANPLSIVQVSNLLFGIGAVMLTFFIAQQMTSKKLFSFLTALLCAFLNIYWYQSYSGEVYISAYCFLLLSFYCLLKMYTLQREDPDRAESRQTVLVILGAVFFSFAMAFQLLSGFFAFVVCYFLFLIYREQKSAQDSKQDFNKKSVKVSENGSEKESEKERKKGFPFLKYIFIFGAVSCAGFTAVYILPFIFYYNLHSPEAYLKMLFLYSSQFGLWNSGTASGSGPAFSPLFFISPLWQGSLYFLKALFYSSLPVLTGLRILFIIFIVIYLLFLKKDIYTKTLFFWFLLYFVIICIVIHLPAVNDYWIFNIFPFVLFLCLILNNSFKKKVPAVVLTICVLSVFSVNCYFEIFPKRGGREKGFYVTAPLRDTLKKYDTIVFMMNNTMFAEVWYHSRTLESKNVRYLFDENEYPGYEQHLNSPLFEHDLAELLASLKETEEFLLIMNTNSPCTLKVKKALSAVNFTGTQIKYFDIKHPLDMYRFSVGNINGNFDFMYRSISVMVYKRHGEACLKTQKL